MAEEGKMMFSLSQMNEVSRELYLIIRVSSSLEAEAHLDEYNEMFEFIVKWTDKARSLEKANIIWNSSSHLQEQIRLYQVNHTLWIITIYCHCAGNTTRKF